MIKTKRVYEKAEPRDGVRILVDRLWPRGLSREQAKLDEWLRDVAPSNELRRWFSHESSKWENFRKRYREELEERIEILDKVIGMAKKGDVTLLYAAKGTQHNNASVLKEFLEEEISAKQKLFPLILGIFPSLGSISPRGYRKF